jgi:hypothetical protein
VLRSAYRAKTDAMETLIISYCVLQKLTLDFQGVWQRLLDVNVIF